MMNMAAGAETLVDGAVPLNRDDDEVGTKSGRRELWGLEPLWESRTG